MNPKDERYFFLLGGLLISLLIAPMIAETYPGATKFALIGTLMVAVWSMASSKSFYVLGLVLATLMVVATVLDLTTEFAGVYLANLVVLFAFCALSTVFALGRVLQGEQVDANRIAGAISIYMLLGILWALLYFMLYLINPEAFKGVAVVQGFDAYVLEPVLLDLLYYSYVTLSTLGYGDITPVSRVAHAFAYLEAICGVMYVAVLVAALVGSYGANKNARDAVEA